MSLLARLFGPQDGDEVIDTLIKSPRRCFTGHDEQLAKRTQERRAIADRTRRRANAVESGASSGRVLQMTRSS